MSSVEATSMPTDALLQSYSASGAYTDCYVATLPRQASFAEFMAAFYTTPIFKLERWLLGKLLSYPSTDREARLLAQGQLTCFAAWHVEARVANQAILAAGRTRSWLMTSQLPARSGATALYFGSALVPRKQGGLGWQFRALLAFTSFTRASFSRRPFGVWPQASSMPMQTAPEQLPSSLPKHLLVVVALYFLASLAHFVHNAEYIAFYPGMPEWIDRETVYLAWLGVTCIGLASFVLLRFGLRVLAVVLLAVYGAFGLDSLAHYTLALCSEHTLMANVTIWAEAVTGVMLLLLSALLLGREPARWRSSR